MKKKTVLMMVLALLLGIMTGTSFAANGNVSLKEGFTAREFPKVNVVIDSQVMKGDVPGVLYNNTTMVPVRFITEGLGGEVAWNGEKEEVEIKLKGKTMYVRNNSKDAVVNGQGKQMPSDVETPKNLSGRIMIPVRFVSEEFGAEVKWDNDTRTVDIKTDRLGTTPSDEDDEETIEENKVQNVTKETVAGREAIIIHNSSSVEYSDFTLSNPNRVVIDIKNSAFDKAAPYGITTNSIREVRTGKPKEGVSRVVLDIRDNFGNVNYQIEGDGNKLLVYVDAQMISKYKVFQGTVELGEFNTKEGAILEAKKWRGSTVLLSGAVVWKFEDQAVGKGKTIVVDAGHGGRDGGAGSASGKRESDLVLSVSKDLERELKAKGYNVIMTRTTDVYLTLTERWSLANQRGADAFISVHFNSAASSSATGLETWYTPKTSRDAQFAKAVQDALIRETGASNRGIKSGNFSVIRNTKMPAVLVELGFINNPKDEPELISKSYHQRTARAIAEGVDTFFAR